jgi:MFS family permease
MLNQLFLWAIFNSYFDITRGFSVSQMIFSAMWGMLADKVGRRPVLLVGLTGSAVAPIIFGMAGSLPVALGAPWMCGEKKHFWIMGKPPFGESMGIPMAPKKDTCVQHCFWDPRLG